MKVDVDIVSPIQRRIRVELPADAVDREFFRVYERLGQRAKIKGFRPGKVPRPVLERLYRDEVRGEVLSRLVEDCLGEIFRERKLQVVSRPEIEVNDLAEGRAFAFSAVVEIKPDVKVKNYLGKELEKVKLSLDEAQVDLALSHLQDGHAHLQPVEDRDVVERGDFVVLDFVGSIDGKPFPAGRAEHYALEVGGRKALAQFEEAIVGLKKDGEHIISVAYPQDYFNSELAGRVGEFRVVVREIKKKILPPLDDEFAKDYGGCASLDELKQKIRARLESELREIQTRDLREQLLTRLIDEHPFEIPPAMLDHQIRYLVERHQTRLAARGSGADQPAPAVEHVRRDLEPHAERQVRAMLLIEKIAGIENIEVSREEVQQRIDAMALSAREKGVSLQELYRRNDAREDLRSQLVFERTLDFLLERSKVKEVEPPVDAQDKKG
jgi:trigger factor